MLKVFTKHPPEKLEYWRNYRRENALKCRQQRSEWRNANRPRIRLCARRSYYRRLLREGNGDAKHIQDIIAKLDTAISDILAQEDQ